MAHYARELAGPTTALVSRNAPVEQSGPVMNHTMVLLRHGESEWNKQNLFTGWVDVPLSERGIAEAREAGRLIAAARLGIDSVHTSVLRRAITTANLALEEMEL